MGNYLDDHPEDAASIATWAETGQMVPIAKDGDLLCFVNRSVIEHFPVPVPLSAEDYIVGLELLGYRLSLFIAKAGEGDVLLHQVPKRTLPPSWRARSLDLMAAFDRYGDAMAFLRERDAVTAELPDETTGDHDHG